MMLFEKLKKNMQEKIKFISLLDKKTGNPLFQIEVTNDISSDIRLLNIFLQVYEFSYNDHEICIMEHESCNTKTL